MAEISAGVLAWRAGAEGPEFLLVHPGGPYWAGKDEAAWSIPKGIVEPREDGWAAARREFEEELGTPITGEAVELPPVKTAGGKVIHAWLVETDLDVAQIRSNTFEMEWPPRSGRHATFPEVDRAAWFDPENARWRIHKGQRPILVAALAVIAGSLEA
ncbi:NUDIX domain-containing protein [Phenylobacterium sp. J426]|uniref:NUDIX domain-containing protein n=1 Tax=Phenylobacterium sp. J426 TaxID=2898439 RepID=UPI0021519A2E|nr:NUDIX domain-containing protein [Phenylobacterium sp. J426]MCR5875992.1 NUDIX domain-containing protein [Phenylobacterium sp. J426]